MKRAPTPEWARTEDAPERVLYAPEPGKRAFGWEVVLAGVGQLKRAVQDFYALGREGRAEDEERRILGAMRLSEALASCVTRKVRERVAKLNFMLAAELRCHGRDYRATGPDACFGVQSREIDGKRVYVRKGEQGGLAERLGVSVRTLYRDWDKLVKHGVWSAWRPPRTAPGAVLTRDGTQVYAMRRLAEGTPRCIVARLPKPVTRPAKRPEPVHSTGRPKRTDEWREELAYLDGADVPY